MATITLFLSALVATAAALPPYGLSRATSDLSPHNLPDTHAPVAPYLDHEKRGAAWGGDASSWYQDDPTIGKTSPEQKYQCFHGNVASYPKKSEWLSFNAMWDQNSGTIASKNDGDQRIVGYIREAIAQVASDSQVDARLILAVMMQESKAQASVPCTWNKWINGFNCGLMQGPNYSCSFDPSHPQSSILQMVRDGVQGTSGGNGLVQYITQHYVGAPTNGNPYAAARAYNSGSVVAGNLDAGSTATASYANDIANRLLGWGGKGEGSPFDGQCRPQQP